MTQTVPTPPLAVGDIVVTEHEHVGGWVAAQVTAVDPKHQTVALLDLDWSGPEPADVADLGAVQPLRLTHQAWRNELSHRIADWTLPPGHRTIGRLPPLAGTAQMWSGWNLGDQLLRQRVWDAGDHSGLVPGEWRGTPADFDQESAVQPTMRSLHMRGIGELDCARLVETFPGLRHLVLDGDLGVLTNAGALNGLTGLRQILLIDLFGMTAADVLDPDRLPDLEALELAGIPKEYAAATRARWRGLDDRTELMVSRARTPEWLRENRDNPLRDWEGDELIRPAASRASLKQWRLTRRAVLEALEAADGRVAERLEQVGREYGEAFNALDERYGFIDTDVREELLLALAELVRQLEEDLGRSLPEAGEALVRGVDAVRKW